MADKKKVIVLDHGGGRLANQLWTDAAVYAYAVEKGYEFESWASFEYIKYFDIPKPKNIFIRLLFFNNFLTQSKSPFIRKWILRKFFKKVAYYFFSSFVSKIKSKNIIRVKGSAISLPPSMVSDSIFSMLCESENSLSRDIFFYGWPFRNPQGMAIHRQEIKKYFKFKKQYLEAASEVVLRLKAKYPHVVGVHIRQGDYKTPGLSHRLFNITEVNKILLEYLTFSRLDKSRVLFLIFSDENVPPGFGDLQTKICNLGESGDLVALSLTDTIIGSPSTYGEFAAYYGNKPFIVFEKGCIDWNSYKNQNSYFENRKSVFAETA